MLSTLKFVKGAVSKKDYQPAFTHFRIADGRILGYNGEIAISTPIDLDMHVCPKAIPFTKAIERCSDDEPTKFYQTESGKVALSSGGFRAYIDCLEDDEVLAEVKPEGVDAPVPAGMVAVLRKLLPITGEDASRPWSNGVLFRDRTACATNNIVVVETTLDSACPVEINVPKSVIQELARVGEDPTHMSVSAHNVTFHYEGEKWIKARIYSTTWPDIARLFRDGTFTPFPDGLFAALETVKPFIGDDGRVTFRDGQVRTSVHKEDGAFVEVPGLPENGAFNAGHLSLLNGLADTIDFGQQPAQFRGHNLRGVILGMRDA